MSGIVLRAEPSRLHELIRQVRPLYRALLRAAARSAATLDANVTAAERAVLERLHDAGAQTVPDIAAYLDLGRQPVQRVVDRLRARALVRREANPRSLRSPHIDLS